MGLIMTSSHSYAQVQDVPKLPGDNGEVPVSEWRGWPFDSYCEFFSLLDVKN